MLGDKLSAEATMLLAVRSSVILVVAVVKTSFNSAVEWSQRPVKITFRMTSEREWGLSFLVTSMIFTFCINWELAV